MENFHLTHPEYNSNQSRTSSISFGVFFFFFFATWNVWLNKLIGIDEKLIKFIQNLIICKTYLVFFLFFYKIFDKRKFCFSFVWTKIFMIDYLTSSIHSKIFPVKCSIQMLLIIIDRITDESDQQINKNIFQ